MPKGLQFLKDIPVIDVAATGVVAELQTVDDHEKGWSESTARRNDWTAGLVGLGAGAGVVALAATSEVTVPVGVVAATAGAAVIGTGDVVYQAFHEHWSEDIHDHGEVAGVLHGTGDVFSNTGEDLWNLGKGAGSAVGDAAKSLWKTAFG
ncbi:hypothetical protein [Williamsia sp. CHRR-6]|uniref:hypothetical protein n=1 Tax=Williamsia sp. CHRR-6 TaxID=2835871 RepID=UPI001BD97B81|nr:hypothetical protein [Williamsia sp. CHRR-6]MBT0567779.1 hypothetical protein [Williamsia sp. CHRR-6]